MAVLLSGVISGCLSVADASILQSGIAVAAIFGFGSNDGNDDNTLEDRDRTKASALTEQQQPGSPFRPPPPPAADDGNHPWNQPRPPPPPQRPQQNQDTPAGMAVPPPPPGSAENTIVWQQDQQQQQHPADPWMNSSPSSPWNPADGYDPQPDDAFHYLQRDLEASLQREHDLAMRLQNASDTLIGMEQREELHVRQLDVLTERVMDVEAQAAEEHNQLLEYQANCSELDLEIAELQGQVDDWKERCLQSEERISKQTTDYTKLEKKLTKAKREAENLATLVERNRLEDLRESYQDRKKTQKASGGLFGWIFGRVTTRDDAELEKLRDMAKATLLNALRTERKSVEELEAAVSTLEQNNSMIAVQIQSRDEIIDQLNERVAVFEEDKLVLKAALKQLQKEMTEEAPKTQKLIQDLEEAQAEIERLETEMEQLIITQQKEITSLEEIIATKEEKIAETEANVTMIGEYVDKLEERLADFSLAKREIEKREENCRDIELKSEQVEQECVSMREQMQRQEREHEEVKALLGELVEERTKLQIQIAQLLADKETADSEVERLRSSVQALQSETLHLQQQLEKAPSGQEWDARVHEYETRLATLTEEHTKMQETTQTYRDLIADMEQKMQEMAMTRQELQALLDDTQSTKNSMETRLSEVIEAQRMAESKVQEQSELYQAQLAESQAQAEAHVQEQQRSLEIQLMQERQRFEQELVQEKERVHALLLLLEEEQQKQSQVNSQTPAETEEETERDTSLVSEVDGLEGTDDEPESEKEEDENQDETYHQEPDINENVIMEKDEIDSEDLFDSDKDSEEPVELEAEDAVIKDDEDDFQSTSSDDVSTLPSQELAHEPAGLEEVEEEDADADQEGEHGNLPALENNNLDDSLTTSEGGDNDSLTLGEQEHPAVNDNSDEGEQGTFQSTGTITNTTESIGTNISTDILKGVNSNMTPSIPDRRNNTDPPGNHTSGKLASRKGKLVPRSEQKSSLTRSTRKLFARATGFHGFFSQKYKRPTKSKKQQLPPAFVTRPINATRRAPRLRGPPGGLPSNQKHPLLGEGNSTNRPPTAHQEGGPPQKIWPPNTVPPHARGQDPPGHSVMGPPRDRYGNYGFRDVENPPHIRPQPPAKNP